MSGHFLSTGISFYDMSTSCACLPPVHAFLLVYLLLYSICCAYTWVYILHVSIYATTSNAGPEPLWLPLPLAVTSPISFMLLLLLLLLKRVLVRLLLLGRFSVPPSSPSIPPNRFLLTSLHFPLHLTANVSTVAYRRGSLIFQHLRRERDRSSDQKLRKSQSLFRRFL